MSRLRVDLKNSKGKYLELQGIAGKMEEERGRLREELMGKERELEKEREEGMKKERELRGREGKDREKLDREIGGLKERLSGLEGENESLRNVAKLSRNSAGGGGQGDAKVAGVVAEMRFRNEQLSDENANLADTMNDQKRQILSLKDEHSELTLEVGSLRKNLEDKTKGMKRILEKKENEILELREKNFQTEEELESAQHTQTLTNFKGTESHNSLLKKIENLNREIDSKNSELTESKTTNKILKKGLTQYQQEKQLSTSKVPTFFNKN